MERAARGDGQRARPRAGGGARRPRRGGRHLRPPSLGRGSRRAAPGTVDRLGTPTILDRDTRHGLDSPTLTYAGHDALLVWRRFRDANTRVLELASVTRAGTVGGPHAITGPPNSFEPAFSSPDLLTFWRRQAAYTIAIANRTAGAKTRLPDGAAFESVVAKLADGRLIAVWPNGGAIFSATRAPGATAFGAATRLSAPGGFARSPQLALTPDGHAVAVWTQSDGTGRALVTAARPPGGAFGAPTTVVASSEQVLTMRALGISAGEVLVAFVSARADIGSGPLRALRLGPTGLAVSSVRTLTPPGERTRDVVARRRRERRLGRLGDRWDDEPPRHPRRAHLPDGHRHGPHRLGLRRRRPRPTRLRDDVAEPRLDRLRDDERPHPPGHEARGPLGRELAADLGQRALLGLVEDREGALHARGVLGEEPVDELLAERRSAPRSPRGGRARGGCGPRARGARAS